MAAPHWGGQRDITRERKGLRSQISRDNPRLCAALVVCRLLQPGRHPANATGATLHFWARAPLSCLQGDLCSFDVSYAVSTINSNETRFFDAAGNQTMFQNHQAEQDTFSANGKTLVSQVYHVTFQGFFDENGDLTLVGNGVFIRVPLPGGGVFIGAGRVNSFGNSSIVLSPDHGAFKNVDRFCAALSP